jgi:hypothetical protein
VEVPAVVQGAVVLRVALKHMREGKKQQRGTMSPKAIMVVGVLGPVGGAVVNDRTSDQPRPSSAAEGEGEGNGSRPP